jgi:hypothetical protein
MIFGCANGNPTRLVPPLKGPKEQEGFNMSVYPFKYKVLNRETGRKVSVTRWRVQIRKAGENINKVFDDESTARSFEEQELKRIDSGVPQNLIFDMKYQLEMPNMEGVRIFV